jgi:hypothetical protein
MMQNKTALHQSQKDRIRRRVRESETRVSGSEGRETSPPPVGV